MFSRLFLVIGLTALVSCGTNAVPEETNEIQRLMDNDPCSLTNRNQCQFERVEAILPKKDQKGEAILIIDAGLQLPAFGVHRKRIVAQYDETLAPPYYKGTVSSVTLPKTMNQIFNLLSETPETATKRLSFSVGKHFEKKYLPFLSGQSSLGHGSPTLNTLAELNPDSPLILVHLSMDPDGTVCKISDAHSSLSLLRHFKEKAEALRKIAERHHVKWVNLSFGFDVRSVKEAWSSAKCEGEIPQKEKLREYVMAASQFIDELASIPEIMIFQATPYPDFTLDGDNLEDFPADCRMIPNRVRVGYLATDRYYLNSRDQRDVQLLDEMERRIVRCADLFVRDGLAGNYTETDYPLLFSTMGLGHSEMNISGSSYTTPIGLSYGQFLVKSMRVSRNQLLTWIRGSTNQPLLISPFSTKSFLNQNHTEYLNWYSRKDVP